MDIGDINGDSKRDLVVMSGQGYTYDNLAVLKQSAVGGLDPAVFYDLGLNENTNSVGVGDVNGDNLDDVVVSYGGNSPYSKLGVFLQNSGDLAPAISLTSYDIPESVEIKDVTGDGLGDVVVLHGGWNKMGVYVQTVDGNLAPEELYNIPYASHYSVQGLALGDINNDGAPDAVIADYNQGLVVLYHESVAPNNPPIADAGPDQSVQLGDTALSVWLDGSNSNDSDNDPLSFKWTLLAPSGSNSTLNDDTSATPSFIADIAGIYTAQLQVFDGKVYSQADSVIITVAPPPPNLPPLADAGPDQTVKQGATTNLDGSQSMDGDGIIAAWSWNQIGGPAVTLSNPTGAITSFTAPKLKGSKSFILTFELLVTDDEGATSVDRVQVTVIR